MSGYENVARLKTMQRNRSKQRKWRVLLSIGLLLPALAAIIGIVAWTISVEVAHGSGADSTDRKPLSHQHQLRSAAYLQFRRQQQKEEVRPSLVDAHGAEPVAAAVQSAPRRRVLHAQQAAKRQQTKSESRDSALLLTNLDQALSGSADVQQPQPTTTTTTTTTAATTEDADDSSSIREQAVRNLASGANQSRASHSLDKEDDAEEQRTEWRPAGGLMVAAKSARHKSRWLAAAETGKQAKDKRSKRPITSHEVSGFAKPESSMAKRQQQAAKEANKEDSDAANNGWPSASGAGKRQRQSRLVKQSEEENDHDEEEEGADQLGRSNNRYTIVSRQENDDAASRLTSSDERVAVAGANSEPGEPAPAAAAEGTTRQRLADDELSFEAIASAISTSLSASSEQPRSLLPAPAEGDTGAISALATSLDEVEGAGEPSAETGDGQQRTRSAGEHVAQVIDHIVERSKQSGAGVQRGPQIVVVAPVGAGMKARSLTKAADEQPAAAAIKVAKKSSKVVEDRRISASTKKGAAALLSGQQQQGQKKDKRRANKPLGARLMGAAPAKVANESEFRYSERVEVIEDDDSSALLFKSAPESREAADDTDRQLALDLHDPSSIHVSSQPDEPKHRAVRHELGASTAFERYAPAASQQQLAPKLYSAQQLIREHVLKAKLKPRQPEEEIERAGGQQAAQEQAKVAPTTSRPHAADSQKVRQQPQPAQEQTHHRQQPQKEYQMESQTNYVLAQSHQASPSTPLARHHHQYQAQAQAQAQAQLPVFADQEYNVPAHLAESVIQNIQRSAPTVSMLSGQVPHLAYHQLQSQSQPQPTYYHYQPQQRAAYLAQQQQQQLLWNQMQQQRQVLANREGAEARAPRGAVHPVAQMALRHLIGSLGQQAAKQQLAADREQQQAARSAGEPAGARSMRSLPIGAQAPANQQQLISDQEVQESYGQVPTYHMGPAHRPHLQQQHHYPADSDDSKKSKGITFHFGGGPIGGGTQLITSPMGIFKHLMIPLLPNPRVNLNGKVVFGVVLEKSTAFGEPKKKYKFWGR